MVKYCSVGGGGGGGAKILQEIMAPPLSVIKMVKYCDVAGGGGGIGGAKTYKYNGAPLSVIKIVKYCGVWGGGGALGGAKILQNIMAPPLSVIKIVKYCGVWGGGGAQSYKRLWRPSSLLCHSDGSVLLCRGRGALRGTKILQKIMAAPLSVIKVVIVVSGEGHWGGGVLKFYKK